MSNYAPYVRFPRRNQQGGGSDWMNSANSVIIQPGTLTEITKKYINDAPMFHPLEAGRRIPTPSTGIYPVGIYYMNQVAQKQCKNLAGCTVPALVQPPSMSGQETLTEKLKKEMSQ